MILALDKGNHSLKAAIIDSGAITRRVRETAEHPAEALEKVVGELMRERPSAAGRSAGDLARKELRGAVFSSVVPEWTRELPGLLAKLGISRVLEVSSRIKLPFETLVESPEKLGADRIAAAAGVISSGDREAVIVDAGTAVTVDVLSERGFLGGAIFPGKGLMYRALHGGAAALPFVALDAEMCDPPGRDTEEAILCGVQVGTTAAIRELVLKSRRLLSKDAPLWVTGGEGEWLARSLGPAARFEADLVFRGLHYLFKMNVG